MKDGASQPHYILVAVADVNLKVYGHHMRMSELKFIAEAVGAELVLLPRGPKHETDNDQEEDSVEVE
jgi:hypothetical protein